MQKLDIIKKYVVCVNRLAFGDFQYVDCIVSDLSELMKILMLCTAKNMVILFDEQQKMFYIPSLRLAIFYRGEEEK